ncbi:ABC transporter ATP-binding protein [Streptomyces abikoensis]
MKLRFPRLRGRRLAATAAAAVVLAGGGTWAAASSAGGDPPVHREDRFMTLPEAPGAGGSVRIDTSFFTAGGPGRRPAVLLAHGFGGSKDDLRGQAEKLARSGYAVLTWSARGFGRSTGRIGLNDPDREVADVSRLLDWLAARPEVELDGDKDPRVGIAGGSYGGAVALLAAGHDKRVDAIAPQVTYWNLADALFPGGVFKKLWAGIFFTSGSAAPGPVTGGGKAGAAPPGSQASASAALGCGRFERRLCDMYERVAVAGKPDAEARELLERRSPSAVAGRIKVPALLFQGQTDSLFPLDHADAAAAAIGRNGAPVAVDWIAGGHDSGIGETDRTVARTRAWFDRYLKGDESTGTGPAFRVSRTGGIDTTDGKAQLRGASGDSYPGLRHDPRTVGLSGPRQTFANPPGSAPPAISAVPGVGGAASQLSGLGVGLSLDFPGQHARFDSARLDEGIQVTGAPTVKVNVRTDAEQGDAVLFAKVYDVGPNGQQVLPEQLVAPVRVTDAKDGRTVELRLPAIDHTFESGHRMRLVLAATDLGYASPAAPATYSVSLEGGLSVPTAPEVRTASAALPWWTWGLPLGGAVVAAALLLTGRRRVTAPARTRRSPRCPCRSPG